MSVLTTQRGLVAAAVATPAQFRTRCQLIRYPRDLLNTADEFVIIRGVSSKDSR